jgi:transposase
MDDNARPHRSRAVTAYLQSEAVTSVPWPTMRPVLNPIEHIWDMLVCNYGSKRAKSNNGGGRIVSEIYGNHSNEVFLPLKL